MYLYLYLYVCVCARPPKQVRREEKERRKPGKNHIPGRDEQKTFDHGPTRKYMNLYTYAHVYILKCMSAYSCAKATVRNNSTRSHPTRICAKITKSETAFDPASPEPELSARQNRHFLPHSQLKRWLHINPLTS